MAEVLLVAGGVASFASIAKVASHLVQGCLSLRQLLKDAKTAPDDIRKLVDELETLMKTAEGVERTIHYVEGEDLRTKVDEAVRPALEGCVGVVDGLKSILAEYENGFQKAAVKAWWEKIKVVKGKKAICKLLQEIERSKVGLILAQQNALSIVLHNSSQFIDRVSNESMTMFRAIDKTFNQGEMILEISNATERKISDLNIRQREDSEKLSTMVRQMEQNSTSQSRNLQASLQTLDLARSSNFALPTTIDDMFNQGESILTITKRTEEKISESEICRKEDSQRLQNLERQLQHISEIMGNGGSFVSLVTQKFDTHDRNQREGRVAEQELSHHITSHIPDTERTYGRHVKEGLKVDAAVQCGKYKPLSSLLSPRRRTRRNEIILCSRYLSIVSTTWQDHPENEDWTPGHPSSKVTETRITFRSTLPFFERALYYTTVGTAWDPLSERKIRFPRVFKDDSQIWKACKTLDLNEARRLFASGEASPFMEDQWGWSLPKKMLQYWLRGYRIRFDNAASVLRLAEFLIKSCGRAGIESSSYVTSLVLMHYACGTTNTVSEHVATILRLMLEHSVDDPLDSNWISRNIGLDNYDNPVVTAITQQTRWYVKLDPDVVDLFSGREVVENSRHMLEDPGAERLAKLLQNADSYIVYSLGESKETRPVYDLLKMPYENPTPGLRESCKNRLVLLIGTQRFHHLIGYEALEFDNMVQKQYLDCDVCYIARFAIRNGYRCLLEEVLHQLGWPNLDIKDFFDKETFYCVPDLLDGRIFYQTGLETQREFIIDLCEGAFTELSKDEVELLARQLSYTATPSPYGFLTQVGLESTIKAANIAIAQRTMPGCWPEVGKIKLVPGVDFRIGKGCESDILSWYHGSIDHPSVEPKI